MISVLLALDVAGDVVDCAEVFGDQFVIVGNDAEFCFEEADDVQDTQRVQYPVFEERIAVCQRSFTRGWKIPNNKLTYRFCDHSFLQLAVPVARQQQPLGMAAIAEYDG